MGKKATTIEVVPVGIGALDVHKMPETSMFLREQIAEGNADGDAFRVTRSVPGQTIIAEFNNDLGDRYYVTLDSIIKAIVAVREETRKKEGK